MTIWASTAAVTVAAFCVWIWVNHTGVGTMSEGTKKHGTKKEKSEAGQEPRVIARRVDERTNAAARLDGAFVEVARYERL